jgi:hypothetical protein
MANNQKPKLGTQTEKDEPIFAMGMVRIIKQQTVFVSEHRLGFSERDAMLFPIQRFFLLVPFKMYIDHNDSVNTM